jgi:hypothetical protein
MQVIFNLQENFALCPVYIEIGRLFNENAALELNSGLQYLKVSLIESLFLTNIRLGLVID